MTTVTERQPLDLLRDQISTMSDQFRHELFDMMAEAEKELDDDQLLGIASAAKAERDGGLAGTVVIAAAVLKTMSDDEVNTFINTIRSVIERSRSND